LKEDEPVVAVNPINANTAPTDLFDNSTKGEWYFYNPTLKSKGYTEFRGKWGNRPNADNWRRLSAVNQAIQQKETEDEQLRVAKSAQANDDGNVSYDALLKKLPLTPEKLKASNDSIENAQIELGKALMEGLEDYEAAIIELEKFHERFTYSNRQSEALGYLYYCYLKTGNNQKAEAVKAELQKRHAGTDAEKMITNPKSASAKDPKKEDMNRRYDKIYSLFIEGKFDEALAEKKIGDSLYANNYWTPQLLYIQSIYYIRERLDDSAKKVLQDIINLYPGSILAEKAKTMIDVLGRRKDIESYLTKLEIKRPSDSVENATTLLPNTGNKLERNDSNLIVSPKPVLITDKTAPIKKDSVQTKPTGPLKVAYVSDPAAPHYVVIFTDKVDGVFVTEAKNAFNRYNKQTFYNKNYDITSEILTDTSRLVLMNNFANAEEAITYIDKVRKIAPTEIVPWLPVGKYSFGIITAPNLEMLKSSKDVLEYRKFLQRSFPGKFD
jgi:outer membrane protein assembly factor BamD (BamD/ComL family)